MSDDFQVSVKKVFRSATRALDSVSTTLDDLFDGGLDDFLGERACRMTEGAEGVKVTKTKDGVTIEVEVPGCKSADLDIEASSGSLRLSWKSRMTGHDRKIDFRLSKSADLETIRAKVEDGYATVTVLSRPEETAAPKKVRVE